MDQPDDAHQGPVQLADRRMDAGLPGSGDDAPHHDDDPVALIGLVAVGLALVVPQLQWIPWLVAVFFFAAAAWSFVWARRSQRAWGYAENDEDLLVTSGVMFKRLVAVPYGRMQFVDVQAGRSSGTSASPRSRCTPRAPRRRRTFPGCQRPRRPGCATG